ncbi:MAG TPA: hypothetical protein VHL31_13455 [Geminicoccus sp.]|uniref:hypothetical protein n=1 Tax=Geminicoccus sp. TaxID=2024832 RepID=UPI002E33F824|nr:hypothetical protein [Geminicoccus sp.]HEX2527289.1 hypothetical protein [Geminicoccus sp.]
MTKALEAEVVDLRAVGRDHLAHAIARVLVRRAHAAAGGPVPFVEAYELASEVAEQIERLDWQVLRPNWEPQGWSGER